MNGHQVIRTLPGHTLTAIILLTISSCGPKTIDSGIIGSWTSQKHKITVRTKSDKKFEFTSDSVITSLTIHPDKKVTGTIGAASIEKGRIGTNWILPSDMTGVAYTIECTLTGKIFDTDPLEKKEVEFWISPKYKEVDWELRYTSKGAQFPMAFIYFDKEGSN